MSLSASRASVFTVIELLVAIAIVCVLAGLLMPVMGLVKPKARELECGSSVSQCILAQQVAALDNLESWRFFAFTRATGTEHTWSRLLMEEGYWDNATRAYCPAWKERFMPTNTRPSMPTMSASSSVPYNNPRIAGQEGCQPADLIV